MPLGGFTHRELVVDLTAGRVDVRPLDEDLARTYIGGRGLGVKYVFDNGPQVEPFSPDNLLCIMTGPVTGSLHPMSGRLAVVTKSPLTGTVTDSHMGGWTAARLKWAGFDNILIKGQSPHPVYLYIEAGRAELRDASDLWGLGVRETIRRLKDRHGADDLSVMAIGPAGENLVRYAGWINEHDRAAGRGGTGAVAGYKRLKAIVIKASEKGNLPRPADPEASRRTAQRAMKAIVQSPVTAPRKGGLSVYGTNVLTNIINEVGALPTMNSRYTHFDGAEGHSGERVNATILVADNTCHACPVACKKEVEVKSGKYRTRTESFEYESGWALGANCGLSDAEAIAYMIDRCNDYGIDTIEVGHALSTAMEAYERGLIDEEVRWGDADKMIALIDDIAFRRGLGDRLAEGPARFAREIGAPEISMSVKGQSIPAYDPRGIQGIGLGYATSNRGACHLRGYSVAAEIMGIPEPVDRLAVAGKGALLKMFQDLHAFSDSMDICKFSAFAESAEHYAEQYSAMTGIPMTVDELLKAGERIYNLERYYNNLAGFNRREDDLLPERFLKEPGTGHSSGAVSHLSEMLDEYYRVRGWKDGVVPEEKLRELGIIA
ncbi:aldehyde ferredoxin oxidoreductase family protein [Hydrogenibacillus schlegelii]|uniref:Aldehyde ferredoxin oxidoreductase family protein n=1 Tax=Hydrogenibacillus schlegelii TaxID=1484 RepID=A0A132N679_HYDSH|nr:aldehyde ferredoxin oxidoreductase family protein [Hydrogenibacillus schlegelii]KWX05614.1 aldehyde:ferredoxin oxidoreductase [Hydrogenibacillus schlegelii]MBT9282402.1 aldehyde ferredoxin oxidoreductase family protein [Hydrogenibacillus schlegelii]OAR05511.1 aldehyde:ferredoxin oxidoreductase [Hydrogenibacillus schlegelii]PTQ54047.1 MAG: Tungsten-containing aldehyde:ferredoxin oxidoreductase [Hydrogenibacillus schlegelii]